jgi:predicted PurR-regulated permease PerM
MKEVYIYLGIIVLVFGYLLFIQRQTNKYIDQLESLEVQKRKELRYEIDKLQSKQSDIDSSINTLKTYIDKKDIQLNTNIQLINSKKNVQIRNVSDSTYNAILQILLPK